MLYAYSNIVAKGERMKFIILIIALTFTIVTDVIAGAGSNSSIVKSVSFSHKENKLCALIQSPRGKDFIFIINSSNGSVLRRYPIPSSQKNHTEYIKYDLSGRLIRFEKSNDKLLVKREMSNKTDQIIKYPSKYWSILEVTDFWGPNYGQILFGDTREYGKKYVYNNANGKLTVIKNSGTVAFTPENVAVCHNGNLDIIYNDGNIKSVSKCPEGTDNKFKIINKLGYFILSKGDFGEDKSISIYDFDSNRQIYSQDVGRFMPMHSTDMTEELIAYGGLDEIQVYDIRTGKLKYTVDNFENMWPPRYFGFDFIYIWDLEY